VIEYGTGVVVDNEDNYYITGYTNSEDFPILNAYDDTNDFYYEAFVVKFAFNNDTILWSTYLGGESSNDYGMDIAISDDNSCFVIGYTICSDFPIDHAFDSTYGGSWSDGFITKFSSDGSLIWSTFLGGSDTDDCWGIAVNNDYCYVAGETRSSDFPTYNAFNDTYGDWGYPDAFVTKFSEIENDDICPIITNVSNNPLSPTSDDTIAISCTSSDADGIYSVVLSYQINDQSWINKQMAGTIADNYSTTVGPFDGNDIIKYYIKSIDDSVYHNIAMDDNETHFYTITIIEAPITTTTKPSSAYGLISFILAIPILVHISQKRRK
ncbi:MAG: SBBP repeat-containing protein, partial [Candidatus Thorarchaeota archaeon]